MSRAGLTPLSWCLDHPGPMVRTVEDAALTMNVIAGHDPGDHATSDAPVPDYTAALTGDIRGLRIGVVREYFETEIDPAVAALTQQAITLLGELGAEIVDVSLPLYEYAQPISNAILSAEATAAHRDVLLSDGDKMYPQVRERLEEGLFISGGGVPESPAGETGFSASTWPVCWRASISWRVRWNRLPPREYWSAGSRLAVKPCRRCRC